MIGRGVYILYIIYLQGLFSIFQNTHFQAPISAGRLLFEFNRLQYTLAAPEVFVSSANLQILLFCRLGTGSASSETQTFTRSKPHPYGIARQIRSRLLEALLCTTYLALGLIGSVCTLNLQAGKLRLDLSLVLRQHSGSTFLCCSISLHLKRSMGNC